MKQLLISECNEIMHYLGRTYEDKEVHYFNWTCSGMEFKFTGKCLLAEVIAHSAEEIEGFTENAPRRTTWPCIAVFLDEQEEPLRKLEISHNKEKCLIYSSEKIETHHIKIIKLSENSKGKAGISRFFMEGEMRPLPKEVKKQLYIEFIGDSITCGFGNETMERDRLFYSLDENGWRSHAAIAARKLNAGFSIVSVSGITVGRGIGKAMWPMLPMNELYSYTDRLLEEILGKKEAFTTWSFKTHIPDFIVINLGTNDGGLIAMEGNLEKGQRNFEKNYYGFLRKIREMNGPKPYIICALGSMDYYLYSNIEKTVQRFSIEFEDSRIRCLKYGKIHFMEGFGACGHPSAITHSRMAEELAEFLTQIIENEDR